MNFLDDTLHQGCCICRLGFHLKTEQGIGFLKQLENLRQCRDRFNLRPGSSLSMMEPTADVALL